MDVKFVSGNHIYLLGGERERQRLEERKKTAEARNDLIDNGQRVKKPTG